MRRKVLHKPVINWESETGQVVSDVTRRVLAWMRHARLDAGADVDAVSRAIAVGFCELVSARAALVLTRQFPDQQWVPRAAIRARLEPSFLDSPTDGSAVAWNARYEDLSDVFFDAPASLFEIETADILTAQPFFVANAAPLFREALAQIGNLWWENQTTSQHSASESNSATPALAVPLAGETNLSGLALLWLESENGLLPQAWRPAIEAAGAQSGSWLAGTLRTERMGRTYQELAALCANALDRRDAARTGHSGAVAHYAGLIARGLGWPEEQIEKIEFAGLLHNIGKATVPESILLKDGPLSRAEMKQVRASINTAADWIAQIDGLDDVALMVRHQGEKWDGSGYPDGLNGEAIPPGSRVLAVALRFAAMTKPRSGRRPMSVVGGAFDRLQKESARALDPKVVAAFFHAMGRTMS